MADRRTRELRKAAMSMPSHGLSEEAKDWLENGPRRSYDCGHAKPREVRLSGPYHACPGCERFERRKVRHWLLLAAVAAVLLAVTCAARAADPCAPYSPVDGKSCQAPTVLRDYRGVPICICPPRRVAGRP